MTTATITVNKSLSNFVAQEKKSSDFAKFRFILRFRIEITFKFIRLKQNHSVKDNQPGLKPKPKKS